MLLALEDVAQELHESEDDGGVHPGAVAHRTPQEGVVVFEYQCVCIDQKELFHRIFRFCFIRRIAAGGRATGRQLSAAQRAGLGGAEAYRLSSFVPGFGE